MFRHYQGIPNTPGSGALSLRGGDLGYGSSPYAGHLFQQFWLFGLEDCRREDKRIAKKKRQKF
jgi:hypothetical protein